ncbi:hypothetical protein MC885_001268 [Smutsia gigantea]|nr:hypothetical protein MC885_001268 [Smutsia gigantea]
MGTIMRAPCQRSGEKEEVREEEVAAAAGVLAGVPEAEEGSGVDLDFDLETECAPQPPLGRGGQACLLTPGLLWQRWRGQTGTEWAEHPCPGQQAAHASVEHLQGSRRLCALSTMLLEAPGVPPLDYASRGVLKCKNSSKQRERRCPTLKGTHGKKVKNTLHLRSCRAHSIVPVSCFLRQGKAPELNLQHRGLGPQGPKALASALTSNPYVRQLNLQDNGLCGAGAEALIPLTQKWCWPQEVDLPESLLGASRGRAVGAALAGNLALQKLQLAGNGLEEQAAQPLVELLLAHTGLKSLDLS